MGSRTSVLSFPSSIRLNLGDELRRAIGQYHFSIGYDRQPAETIRELVAAALSGDAQTSVVRQARLRAYYEARTEAERGLAEFFRAYTSDLEQRAQISAVLASQTSTVEELDETPPQPMEGDLP